MSLVTELKKLVSQGTGVLFMLLKFSCMIILFFKALSQIIKITVVITEKSNNQLIKAKEQCQCTLFKREVSRHLLG